MSVFAANQHDPVLVRADEAEYLPEIGHYLLADVAFIDLGKGRTRSTIDGQ
ncbi:hypothetical protein AB0395_12120 [Streptosporangium sp. NPDC051023]|uniref:hypothetical protein n=1 Tax=Streptosporangium sp. NPDC051023 TaxID=3155410 RepID=UPI00344EBDB5